MGVLYQANIQDSFSSKNNSQCYFGQAYKLVKTIESTPNNFLQRLIDEKEPQVLDGLQSFYYPKGEIEKREYPTNENSQSEVFDNSSFKFEESGEYENEKPREDEEPENNKHEEGFEEFRQKAMVEFRFSEREMPNNLIDAVFEEDMEEDMARPHERMFEDFTYWKMHLHFDDESLENLLS